MKKFIIIIFCLTFITGCKTKTIEEEFNYRNEIKDLLEKSYHISLFSYGELESENIEINIEDKNYYLVKHESIFTLNELSKLIEEVYSKDRFEIFYNELHERDFIEIENRLYVNDNNQSCDIGQNYDFNDFEIVNETEEYIEIFHDGFYYYIFIKDDKLYLSDDVFKCLTIKKELLQESE